METKEPTFKDIDMTLENYRAASLIAIFALIISATACMVAVVNHRLIVLTGFAIAFALITLFRLHQSGRDKTSGFIFATIALLAPIFCMTAIKTYGYYQEDHLWDTAHKHAQAWLNLSNEGKIYDSFEMTQGVYQRVPIGGDLVAELGTLEDPINDDFRMYIDYEPEKSIRADAKIRDKDSKPEFTWVGQLFETNPQQPRTSYYTLQFNYKRANPDLKDRLFSIKLRRHKYGGKTGVHWNVQSVVNIKPVSIRRRPGVISPTNTEQAAE